MFTREMPEQLSAAQIRDALMEAGQYLSGLVRVAPDARGEGFAEDARSAERFIHEWDAVLTAHERGAHPTPHNLPGGPMAATHPNNPGFQTLGAMVIEDAGYRSFASAHQAGATHQEIEVGGSVFAHNPLFRATITSGEPGGGVFRPVGQPIAPHVRQMRLFLRDILAVQGTNLASIPYIREVDPTSTELSASSVAEGAPKPEVVLDWSLDDAPVRKIAAWVPVTTEIIDDAPTLQGYIDNRLAYLLAVREEQQILFGSGVTPALKGILNFSGVQTQAAGADVPITIGTAIGKVENVDGEADGVVMNPVKYWAMITTRNSSQFDMGLGEGGAPANAPFGTLWGLPVIRSRALATTKAVVGSWRMGATLFDRMQTTIRIGNQHSDYFVNNKVVVLAEERIALAVHRPDFFVDVTLP